MVTRFKGHGSYGGRAGALRAFRRRAPGFDAGAYAGAFDQFCRVYDTAVASIEVHRTERDKHNYYAEAEDIDFDRCMQDLERHLPGYGKEIKARILHWVIFWHYLK